MAKAIGTFPYYGGKQRLCRALDGFADDLQAVVKNMAYQWQEYAAKVNRHADGWHSAGRQASGGSRKCGSRGYGIAGMNKK